MMKPLLTAAILAAALNSAPALAEITITYGSPSSTDTASYIDFGYRFNLIDGVLNHTCPVSNPGCYMTQELMQFGTVRMENGIYFLSTSLSPKRTFLPSGQVFFDLENSFVYYGGENGHAGKGSYLDGEKVSLVQLLERGTTTFSERGDIGDFDFSWQIDREITGITLAYSLYPISGTIPEPETWAMLLTGLGFVGAIARRRRTRKTM
jgi:hypothetical protein